MKEEKTAIIPLSDITGVTTFQTLKEVIEYNFQPFEQRTPENKVKRNPKGYDYVKGSYMDKSFKTFAPLYAYEHVEVQDVLGLGFVRVTVILRNRITGNAEVGTGAARIQLTKEARKKLEGGTQSGILPFDVVDYDKNLKAATEQARKNAQRQFGIAADVYRRQEFDPTEEDLIKWVELRDRMSLKHKMQLQEEFEALGSHFTEWLDEVESNMENYEKKEEIKSETKTEGKVL